MRLMKLALAATALCALPSVADAALVGSLGGGTGPFLSLSSAGLNGGSVATLTGGTVYNSDRPFADIPAGTVFGNSFLAAGPTAGAPATLNFTTAVDYLSFLWGSPDTYNALTVVTNFGTYAFNTANLGFAVSNGSQNFSQYVQFAGSDGEQITSVSFDNSPKTNAFETANFSVAAVPEPATWAMMLIGFGAVGYSMRRRKSAKIGVQFA